MTDTPAVSPDQAPGKAPGMTVTLERKAASQVALQVEATADEVEAVHDVLGQACRLTGFYSYGEIAPMENSPFCDLHNQTMTITTIAEA